MARAVVLEGRVRMLEEAAARSASAMGAAGEAMPYRREGRGVEGERGGGDGLGGAHAAAAAKDRGLRTSFQHVAHPNATSPRRVTTGVDSWEAAEGGDGVHRDCIVRGNGGVELRYGQTFRESIGGEGNERGLAMTSPRYSWDGDALASASASVPEGGAEGAVEDSNGSQHPSLSSPVPGGHQPQHPPADSTETGAFIDYYTRLLGVSARTLTEDGGERERSTAEIDSDAPLPRQPGWD